MVLQIFWKRREMLQLTLEVSHRHYLNLKFHFFLCYVSKLSEQQCAGIVVLVSLFLWENKKEEEQMVQITRDETLSRLPLRLSTNRVVELVQLRDTVRPVSFLFHFLLPQVLISL